MENKLREPARENILPTFKQEMMWPTHNIPPLSDIIIYTLVLIAPKCFYFNQKGVL